MLLLLLQTILSNANAAEVTRMPDAMHAEAGFTYRGSADGGNLLEGDLIIANRSAQEHGMSLAAAFSPTKGIAITVGLDVTASWTYTFTNARTMLLEPVDGGGSYANSDPADDAQPIQISGSGLDGIWLGLSLSPFSESYQQHHRITWKVDVAVRTGSKTSNRWTVQNGGRGGGPGSTAFRVSGAFSRRTGVSEPYLTASYQNESQIEVDVRDEAGMGALLLLRPASTTKLRGGCEIHAADTEGISMDVWFGFRYRSPENLPSGILLPNVLDSAKTIAITHSDTLSAQAGLGVHITFTRWLRASIGAHGTYTVPHTQEHVFAVRTSVDTVAVGWYGKLTGSFGANPE